MSGPATLWPESLFNAKIETSQDYLTLCGLHAAAIFTFLREVHPQALSLILYWQRLLVGQIAISAARQLCHWRHAFRF